MVLSYHHLILVSYYLLLLSYHSLRKKATKSTQYVKENPTCSALPVLAGVGYSIAREGVRGRERLAIAANYRPADDGKRL